MGHNNFLGACLWSDQINTLCTFITLILEKSELTRAPPHPRRCELTVIPRGQKMLTDAHRRHNSSTETTHQLESLEQRLW